jgi:hypothetical protein
MSRSRIFKLLLAVMASVAACQAQSVSACAMCYNSNVGDSPLAAGMNWGIMSLLVVVVFVLSSFASFFIFLARKAAAAARSVPQQSEKLEASQKA